MKINKIHLCVRGKGNFMYPLLLKPPIKDYLLGGTKLKSDFGFDTDKDVAAEAWMLSCHKDGMNIVRELAVCDKFSAKLLTLNELIDIYSPYSFVSLIILDGNANIKWGTEEIEAKKGDSIFIPAGLEIKLCGNAEILYSCV